MVHLVAMLANDADHMPSLLYALRNEVAVPEEALPGETWGVGYYAEERALIIRKPAELLTTRTVFELAPNVQSGIVLACVDRGPGPRDHAPPHRFRGWLFGYSGDLAPLGALSGRILDKLPDFVRSELGGASGGALVFGMFIAELHRAGLLDDPLSAGESFGQALSRTAEAVRMLAREVGSEALRATYVATNGRLVLASRSGAPLHWKVQEGLEPSPQDPIDMPRGEFKRLAEALKRFRAVVLTGEVVHGRPGWTELADGATYLVDRKLNASLLPARAAVTG